MPTMQPPKPRGGAPMQMPRRTIAPEQPQMFQPPSFMGGPQAVGGFRQPQMSMNPMPGMQPSFGQMPGMAPGFGGGGGYGQMPGMTHPAFQNPFQAGSHDRNTPWIEFLRRLFAGQVR